MAALENVDQPLRVDLRRSRVTERRPAAFGHEQTLGLGAQIVNKRSRDEVIGGQHT